MVKKIKNRLIAIPLGISLLLNAGCLKQGNCSSNITTENITREQQVEEELIGKSEATCTQEVEDELVELQLEEYIEFFNDFESNYKAKEYLITNDEVQQIISNANTKKECAFVFDGDYDTIESIIKNNSHDYVQDHPEFKDYFLTYYEDSEDYEDSLNFNIAFSRVIDSIRDISINDIDEDIHMMQTLKIVVENTEKLSELSENIIYDNSGKLVLGYYDEVENLIVISIDNIKKVTKSEEEFNEQLFTTLMHEVNHMRQMTCDCRIEQGDQVLSVNYEDRNSFFTESSATSEIYNLKRNNNYHPIFLNDFYPYTTERESENLLFLMVLTEYKYIEQYYNAIFDSDINAFCDFFNATNLDQINTLYQIIYSIDAQFGRNSFAWNYYSEDEINNITYGKLKDDVGYGYRTEIFKIALQNLIEYTENNKDFELKDNLVLLEIIRSSITDNAYSYEYIESDEYENGSAFVEKYDLGFVNDIITLNNKYIEYLCLKYDVTKEDIDSYDSEIDNALSNIKIVVDIEYGDDKASSKLDSRETSEISYATNLCRRFPMIKPIIYTDYISTRDYDNFIYSNDLEDSSDKVLMYK